MIAAAVIELLARHVARRPITDIGAPWLILLAVAGALTVARIRRWTAPLFFAVLFTAGLVLQLHLGARLQSDGFYYYAYLRSLTFDRDVEFSNDYRMLGLGNRPHLFTPTPTGYAQSAWTIGPAIVWSPFFGAGHLVATRLQASGAAVSTDGTSYPYRQAVCVAGLFFGLLGSWFAFRFAALFFAARLAALATTLVIGGSFMLWYIVKEPSMTHAPSMASVAGFAWLWAATRGSRTLRQWALLGAVAGFMALIRWQNVLFALLPAAEAFAAVMIASRQRNTSALRSTILAGLAFTACATLAFVPQMLAWKSIYGSFLAVSPVGPQIRWWDPHLVDVLFSSRNGLLSWSPILYVGAIGLLLFAWRVPAVGVPAIAAMAVMVYFNASIQDWWGSAGFGGRRFDGTLPFFVLGVAALAERAASIVQRHPLRVVAGGGVLLVLWNVSMMGAAQNGQVRVGESVSFGEAGAHQARVLHDWFGYPFSYPINVMFAVKNDVPIATYDVLGVNRFLGDPERQFGRVDIGQDDEMMIEGGWHAPEQNGPLTFRWAQQTAVIRIPLDRAADLLVQVRAQAFNYPGAAPQHMNVYVNDRAVATAVALPADMTTIEFAAAEEVWHAGVNRMRLEFSRADRPADVGLGGDPRSLAALVDYVRIQVKSP